MINYSFPFYAINSRIVEVRLFESGSPQLPPGSQNKFDTLRTVLVLKYTFDSESTPQATFTKFLTLKILGLGEYMEYLVKKL